MSDMGQQLAAALSGHEVTNEDGNLVETATTIEESAPQEKTTDEESATVETTASEEPTESKPESDEAVSDLAEDESGRRYVPEKRFKEIYGKQKEAERELQALREQLARGSQILQGTSTKKSKESTPIVDKADVLELKMTLPQFNPASPDYSQDLDNLGYQILRANPGMTPLEAGYRAIETAKNLAKTMVKSQAEARNVKVSQSDQGITTRVTSRIASEPNIDDMSADEMESYLKSKGLW